MATESAARALRALCPAAIRHFGASPDAAQPRAFCAAAGVAALQDYRISRHSVDVREARVALERLGYTAEGAWAGEVPAAAMGAARVVALMGAGAADAGVAQAGAEALCSLAASDDGGAACEAAGAPRALVTALTLHLDEVAPDVAASAEACRGASAALLALGAHERCRAAIVGAGAVAALAKALQLARSDGARENARAALEVLGYSDLGRWRGAAPTLEMGAARVVALMGAGAGDAAVAEAGARALLSAAQQSGGGAACVDAGAPRAVVAALVAHPGREAAVCEAGCLALAQLARSDAGGAACVAAGAPLAVVAAVRAHIGEGAACSAICQALACLAASDAGAAACVAAGAPQAVAAIFERPFSAAFHPPVKTSACVALLFIKGHGPLPPGAEAELPSVVVALLRHAAEPFARKRALAALESLGFTAAGERG